ncbi:MAG: TetR/AcrR family transcriptional regulator [Actinomycetia bacterium]|nr:TetR/AcrR family transcriptional regulator [Actinomycetes bacterium]
MELARLGVTGMSMSISTSAPRTGGLRPSTRGSSVRRRAAIVAATRELLRQSEPDEVMVADIAEHAGVSLATVYNLVGRRDQLLLSVIDGAVNEIRESRPASPRPFGVEAITSIMVATSEVMLSDPLAHRRVLGALGQLAPGAWLASGLTGLFQEGVSQAIDDGALDGRQANAAFTTAVQFGFRGVLISWTFGQLPDEELRHSAELQALYVLAYAATESARPQIERRIAALNAKTKDK